MNHYDRSTLHRGHVLCTALAAMGILLACGSRVPQGMAADATAASGDGWKRVTAPEFSFDYPAGWTVARYGTTAVRITDPQNMRRLRVSFLAGARNQPSWAQQCQSLDDLLIGMAQDQQKEAAALNQERNAGSFELLQVTFEGPHPGNPGTIGGQNIRISTVQNRGGFAEPLAFDEWITAVARSNGVYTVSMFNPRSDTNAQAMWEKFVRSVSFTGQRVGGAGCP